MSLVGGPGRGVATTADPSIGDPPIVRRRRRRWLAWCLALIAVPVGLRLAAPMILAPLITSRLSTALGVPVCIDGVEIALWAGAVTVRGIAAAPAADVSASLLRVDAATVRWEWDELRRGTVALDVALSGVDVTLDLHRPWPAVDAAKRGPRSLPPRLRSLEVVDGAVAVVLAADTPPILALTGVQASLVETSMGFATEAMTTRLSVRADTGGGGHLTIDGSLAPVAPAATWTLRFALDRLDLRQQNPLFQEVLEMDVEQGWLSLAGELTVGHGRLRGRMRPRFDELKLLAHSEPKARHPMAEALFGSMLSGADLPIDIDRAAVVEGGSMLAELAKVDAKELLTRIILQGFVRRLDTLDGTTSSASRLEVDFPNGRLSFFDVTLTRIGGAVGRPFVEVDRLDIIVEQTAVDSETLTYKAIVLHAPSLIFVTGETLARSQLTFDPDWQTKVSVLPYPTDRLEILDGRVEYRDDTTEPPTSVFVSDLDLRVENLGRAQIGGVRRGATLEGSARAMDLSPLTLDVVFTPAAVQLDASVRLRLDPLPLVELNELLRGALKVDVSSGTLAMTADLDVLDGRLHGTVTPALRRVWVIGKREVDIQHPIRELLLERRLRRLDGVPLKLDYQVRKSLLRELPGALLSAALRAR